MAVKTAAVTVGTAATLLADPTNASVVDQMIVVVRNGSGSTVYVGGADVTAANGLPLPDGTSLSLNLGPSDVLYGIVASSTAAVSVLRTRS